MTDAELEELKADLVRDPALVRWEAWPRFDPKKIAALIARLEAAEGGWQDISTAPKDGEPRVLVWIEYTREEAARSEAQGREEVARWSSHCEGWLLDHDAFNEGHHITHWRYLPAPPSKREEA